MSTRLFRNDLEVGFFPVIGKSLCERVWKLRVGVEIRTLVRVPIARGESIKGSWMRPLYKAEASVEYVAARSLIYVKRTLEVLQRRFELPFGNQNAVH